MKQFHITGKSIKQLLKEYGTGESGFYPQNWYKNESFFTDKPEAGLYEIDFETDLIGLTYEEQLAKIPEGFSVPHPAVICEAVLSHYKETGKRLLEKTYTRTSALGQGGLHVRIGVFVAEGLLVDDWDDDRWDDRIGVASARKLPLNTGSLETSSPNKKIQEAIILLKKEGYQIAKLQ